MSMGIVWVVGSVVICTGCGLGVALCREIMLGEVKRYPEGQNIKYPYLSWTYPEVIRVHQQLYPESRIRAVSRFLTYVGFITIGSLGLGVFVPIILRPIFQ
jgi:hypothetical protein